MGEGGGEEREREREREEEDSSEVGKKGHTTGLLTFHHFPSSPFSCCVLCDRLDVWSQHLGSRHSHDGGLYDHPPHVWLHASPWYQRQRHLSRQPCHGKLGTPLAIYRYRTINRNPVALPIDNYINVISGQ